MSRPTLPQLSMNGQESSSFGREQQQQQQLQLQQGQSRLASDLGASTASRSSWRMQHQQLPAASTNSPQMAAAQYIPMSPMSVTTGLLLGSSLASAPVGTSAASAGTAAWAQSQAPRSSNVQQHPDLPRSYSYYTTLARLHFFFLLCDLLLSVFGERSKSNFYLFIGVLGLQLLLILCNLFLLFIAFTNTQPFKAGLLRLLVNCACFSLPTIASSTKLASGNGNSMPRARGATSNSAISASGDFNATVWMSVVYFGVCAGTRGYELQLLLACTASGLVCNPFGDLLFRLLYVLFRVTAVGYYFHFKRAIFAICDPKYYRVDSTWLKEKLRHLK